ncbi:hypothetical protein AV530_012210 [Patagioenas fasciata monilis]|uniref:Uncharacterized protein n=1 Tax=Patagioenas fasciata monilis TaxID=372326 RepID=A0A1V4K595_PATFA|nr:hypothetical protein AV530_012210 [Patagioenas fasciata monilis]
MRKGGGGAAAVQAPFLSEWAAPSFWYCWVRQVPCSKVEEKGTRGSMFAKLMHTEARRHLRETNSGQRCNQPRIQICQELFCHCDCSVLQQLLLGS